MKARDLDLDFVCENFAYNEDSPSCLVWAKGRGRKAKPGMPAGCLTKNGYWYIGYGYRHYLAHRIIWQIHYGIIPEGLFVDHINRNRSDNRIDNLRVCTFAQNKMNTDKGGRGKSGYKGVFPLPNGKFQAQIGVNGKSKYLGTFSSAKEAAVAYDLAAIEYHREFRKTNFDSDFPES